MPRILKISSLIFLSSGLLLGGILWKLFWGDSFFLKNNGKILLHNNHSVELVSQENKTLYKKNPPKFYHTLEELSQHTIDFLIFQEDQSFFSHSGYSLRDIFIVLYDYIFKGNRLRGASTITQQLARSLFINRQHSLGRKLVELHFARLLEKQLSKEQILELYFNHVYWGRGVFGIGSASRIYFDCEPKFLSPHQSMFLTSLLPYPAACYNLSTCTNKGVLRRMKHLQRWHVKHKMTNSY